MKKDKDGVILSTIHTQHDHVHAYICTKKCLGMR